jgi:hypothetical protein
MYSSSTAVAVLFGVVIVLTSIEKAHAHDLHHAVDEYQVEDPTIPSRGLFADSGDAETPLRPCGTGTLTKSEVQAFAGMVDSFYQGEQGPDGHRRLQGKITVPVNFIAIKDTQGQGATPAQVIAQIDHLNTAFKPDFEFVLAYTKVVVDNNFYNNVDYDDEQKVVERQMKTLYKVGGKETLSIYATWPTDNMGGFVMGWAYYPSDPQGVGVLDGVVMRYSAVPNGGSFYFSEGDVSIENKSC